MPFGGNDWLDLKPKKRSNPICPSATRIATFGTCGPSAYRISATCSTPCAEREPANPPPIKLTGVGCEIRLSRKVGAPMGRGVGETSQLPEIKYELKPADPFSLYGRRLG